MKLEVTDGPSDTTVEKRHDLCVVTPSEGVWNCEHPSELSHTLRRAQSARGSRG